MTLLESGGADSIRPVGIGIARTEARISSQGRAETALVRTNAGTPGRRDAESAGEINLFGFFPRVLGAPAPRR